MHIFLFHRDLRTVDNMALAHAVRKYASLVPVFILVDEQIDATKNAYFSHNAVQFMCESLKDLNDQLHGSLNIFRAASVVDQLSHIHSHSPISSITQNRDFSVYAQKRDAAIVEWCAAQSPPIAFHCECEDYDLVDANQLLLPESKPYTVLAAYYNKFLKEQADAGVVRKCQKTRSAAIPIDSAGCAKLQHVTHRVSIKDLDFLYHQNHDLAQRGGRSCGLKRLKDVVAKIVADYDATRNYPALVDGTTQLSAHLKFGTISVRELYWAIVKANAKAANPHDHPLIRELVFRSFYIKICSARPGLQRSESFRQDIDDGIPWLSHTHPTYATLWKAWKEGRTGFPMVDAGMRQLNATGWMHGRARMVAATVLTRYFLIDWREGAKYFAQHLVDYDPCSNNMGWQFSAALGENSQNVYRAPMNPFLQAKNYDVDAIYIKRWVPELSSTSVTPKQIHTASWDHVATNYSLPIIDQKDASRKAVALWKAAANAIKK